MKIERLHEGKIKISLEWEDLRRMDTTFEELDYEKAETRKIISTLLKQALEQIGFDCSNSRLLIEAVPSNDGGCLLYFTTINTNEYNRAKKPLKKQTVPYIFEFPDIDTMLNVISVIKEWASIEFQSNSLYSLEGKYVLVFQSSASFAGEAGGVLSEYGRMIGKGAAAAAYVAEHGTLICESDAVERLSSHFC